MTDPTLVPEKLVRARPARVITIDPMQLAAVRPAHRAKYIAFHVEMALEGVDLSDHAACTLLVEVAR